MNTLTPTPTATASDGTSGAIQMGMQAGGMPRYPTGGTGAGGIAAGLRADLACAR